MLASLLQLSAGVIAFVDAIPISPDNAFSIDQIEAGERFIAGPGVVGGDLARYGILPSPKAQAFATSQDGTSVTANPGAYDIYYLSTVNVGGQMMTLNFDSGSSDLWVFSDRTPASQQGSHELYKTAGKTLMTGQNWNISYLDGSGAAGVVYADKVVIGSATVTSQAVEAATSVSPSFVNNKADGLLGLGMGSLNTVRPVQQKTWFDNIKASLPAPLFVSFLRYHAPGTYDFGYIDKDKYVGDIVYTNVNSNSGFWQYTFNGYAIGAGAAKTYSYSAVADTGTSLLYMPSDICNDYYSFPGATTINGHYVFLCATTAPDFSMAIEGVLRTMPGQYMNYAPATSDGKYCFGGMQPNTGLNFALVGDIFLKSQYLVHDKSTNPPRLGWAQQNTDYVLNTATVGSTSTSSTSTPLGNVSSPTGIAVTLGAPPVVASSTTSSAKNVRPSAPQRTASTSSFSSSSRPPTSRSASSSSSSSSSSPSSASSSAKASGRPAPPVAAAKATSSSPKPSATGRPAPPK